MFPDNVLFYGAYLNENSRDADRVESLLIQRGLFASADAIRESSYRVDDFFPENPEKVMLPLRTDDGTVYFHLYLIDNQPWEEPPRYFVGYPVYGPPMSIEQLLVQSMVDLDLERFCTNSRLSLRRLFTSLR